MENIDRKILVEQGLKQFSQDESFQKLFEWLLKERDRQWVQHLKTITNNISAEAKDMGVGEFVDCKIIPLVIPMVESDGGKMSKISDKDFRNILDKITAALALNKEFVLCQHSWGITLIVGTNLIASMNKAFTTLSRKENIDETIRYWWK